MNTQEQETIAGLQKIKRDIDQVIMRMKGNVWARVRPHHNGQWVYTDNNDIPLKLTVHHVIILYDKIIGIAKNKGALTCGFHPTYVIQGYSDKMDDSFLSDTPFLDDKAYDYCLLKVATQEEINNNNNRVL